MWEFSHNEDSYVGILPQHVGKFPPLYENIGSLRIHMWEIGVMIRNVVIHGEKLVCWIRMWLHWKFMAGGVDCG